MPLDGFIAPAEQMAWMRAAWPGAGPRGPTRRVTHLTYAVRERRQRSPIP